MLNVLLYSMFRTMMYLLWSRINGLDDNEAKAEAMGYINRLDDDWLDYNRSQG